MSLDIDAIKARLASFEKKDKKSSKIKDATWKPEVNKTALVRIVPYQQNPKNPFIELKFHYGLNGKNYLSPASFNQPDPVVELSDRLKKSGDKDQWRIGRSMEPKMRTFVPVIVRGEEDKGVRFWGFGITVYKQLMAAMADVDYDGKLIDLQEGYDIKVECKEASGEKKYPETTIRVSPKQRPAIEAGHPKAALWMDLITNKQPNILEVYSVASYEDLAKALEEYLKKGKEGQQEQGDDNITLPTDEQIEAAAGAQPAEAKPVEATTTVSVAEIKVEAPKAAEPVVEAPKPAAPVVSPSAAKAATNVADLTKVFDNLFNS